MKHDAPPNTWQPTEADRPNPQPKTPISREGIIQILSTQIRKWAGRKRAYSPDASVKMIRYLEDSGFETDAIMPARTAYQLLHDMAKMILGLVERLK